MRFLRLFFQDNAPKCTNQPAKISSQAADSLPMAKGNTASIRLCTHDLHRKRWGIPGAKVSPLEAPLISKAAGNADQQDQPVGSGSVVEDD